MNRQFQCATDPTMIRAWSKHETVSPQPASQPRLLFTPTTSICIEKYNISRSGYHSKFHRILRLPRKVTLQLHQLLRLPRKVTLIIDPLHTWNVIYNARSNKCHCPNSPNTAPATKNDTWTSRNIAPATKNDLLDWALPWASVIDYNQLTWYLWYWFCWPPLKNQNIQLEVNFVIYWFQVVILIDHFIDLPNWFFYWSANWFNCFFLLILNL